MEMHLLSTLLLCKHAWTRWHMYVLACSRVYRFRIPVVWIRILHSRMVLQ